MRLSSFKLMIVGAAIAAGVGLTSARAADPSAVGLWEQVDENTGKAESWFRITEKNGVYQGNIVKIFPKPGDDPNEKWLCDQVRGRRAECAGPGTGADQGNAPERSRLRGRHDHGPARRPSLPRADELEP